MHAQESARDTRGGTRGVAGRAATAYLPRRVLSFGLVVTAALTGVACANCQAASARACGDRGRWAVRDCAAREVDCLLRLRGGRKGVAAKHTAKEMALKTKLATKNMGGGKEGLADRQGGKAGHAKVVRACEHASACVVCVCDWLRQTSVARCMRARTSFRCCALGAAGAFLSPAANVCSSSACRPRSPAQRCPDFERAWENAVPVPVARLQHAGALTQEHANAPRFQASQDPVGPVHLP